MSRSGQTKNSRMSQTSKKSNVRCVGHSVVLGGTGSSKSPHMDFLIEQAIHVGNRACVDSRDDDRPMSKAIFRYDDELDNSK